MRQHVYIYITSPEMNKKTRLAFHYKDHCTSLSSYYSSINYSNYGLFTRLFTGMAYILALWQVGTVELCTNFILGKNS